MVGRWVGGWVVVCVCVCVGGWGAGLTEQQGARGSAQVRHPQQARATTAGPPSRHKQQPGCSAGGVLPPPTHLVLAVPHEALVVPRHILAGHDDVRLKALLIPGKEQERQGEVGRGFPSSRGGRPTRRAASRFNGNAATHINVSSWHSSGPLHQLQCGRVPLQRSLDVVGARGLQPALVVCGAVTCLISVGVECLDAAIPEHLNRSVLALCRAGSARACVSVRVGWGGVGGVSGCAACPASPVSRSHGCRTLCRSRQACSAVPRLSDPTIPLPQWRPSNLKLLARPAARCRQRPSPSTASRATSTPMSPESPVSYAGSTTAEPWLSAPIRLAYLAGFCISSDSSAGRGAGGGAGCECACGGLCA